MDKLPFFDTIENYLSRKKIIQTLTCLQLLLVATISNALAPNPGATCPVGYEQGKFTDSNYTSILNNGSTYTTITSNPNIPLKVNITEKLTGSITLFTTNSTTVNNSNSGNYAFNSYRNFANTTSYIETTLTFQNSNTSQPIYLTNLALSAFDIDYTNYTLSNGIFDDRVLFTGINSSGATVVGSYQSITGSNVRSTTDGTLYTTNTTAAGCNAKDLDTTCQGSVVFTEPVRSVTIKYGNYNSRISGDPTDQEIDFKVDNYCYPSPTSYKIEKDDKTTSIATGANTTYTIKVTNTGGTTLNNLVLTDPAVAGLTKLSNITCTNTGDTTNTCTSTSLPTIAQLEGLGYTIGSLAVGKSYSIDVPVNVTAASGSTVTNTASVSGGGFTAAPASDTNNVTSAFASGGTPTPASCPAGDKMYYIGDNPPSYSPIATKNLTWTSGITSDKFTFTEPSGNVVINLAFTNLKNLSTSGTPPFYGSVTNLSSNAINMRHTSETTDVNHTLTATINKPVSRFGFVVQDLDSDQTSAYTETLNLDTAGGTFSNVNANYINTLNNGQKLEAKQWKNCDVNNANCDFNVDWGYKPQNTPFSVSHGNSYAGGTTGTHVIAYKNFYFCLAPPKLMTQKVLNGTRAQPNDQFKITTTGPNVNNNFTTGGSGATLSTGTTQSTVMSLNTSATYSIAETIVNSTVQTNYNTTYNCSNNSNSSTGMPSGSGATFDLKNANYGDEITCTITNTPKQYLFSGKVFNDTSLDGVLDANEPPIKGATIALTNCDTTTPISTTTTDDAGNYSFVFAASDTRISSLSKVCLVETNAPGYGNDTTANKIVINSPVLQDYINNNFGDNNTNGLLKLVKYQQVVPCNTPDLAALDSGFTTDDLGVTTKVPSGSCIAYKIEASNLGNVDLTNVVIKDSLLNDAARVSKVYSTPAPKLCISGIAAASCDTAKVSSTTDGNGTTTVTTTAFTIPGTGTTTNKKSTLYFNTLYNVK